MARKVQSQVYVREDQLLALKILSKKTRVSMAELIRQGIDLLLKKEWEQK